MHMSGRKEGAMQRQSQVPAGSSQETGVAWAATVVASGYCLWLGHSFLVQLPAFRSVFTQLAAEVSPATSFVLNNRWLYALLYGSGIAFLVAKEVRMRDKRLSVMVTCLVALVAHVVGQISISLLYGPLMDLVQKLG